MRLSLDTPLSLIPFLLSRQPNQLENVSAGYGVKGSELRHWTIAFCDYDRPAISFYFIQQVRQVRFCVIGVVLLGASSISALFEVVDASVALAWCMPMLATACLRYNIVLTPAQPTCYHHSVKAAIRSIGNSRGIILPKPLISQLNLGAEVELDLEGDAIVIRRPKATVRVGWAKASRDISRSRRSELVWPHFGNVDDAKLRW